MKCFLQILGKTVIKFYLLILLLYKKACFPQIPAKKQEKRRPRKDAFSTIID